MLVRKMHHNGREVLFLADVSFSQWASIPSGPLKRRPLSVVTINILCMLRGLIDVCPAFLYLPVLLKSLKLVGSPSLWALLSDLAVWVIAKLSNAIFLQIEVGPKFNGELFFCRIDIVDIVVYEIRLYQDFYRWSSCFIERWPGT